MSPRVSRVLRRTAIGMAVIGLLLAGVVTWLARAEKVHEWVRGRVAEALGPSLRFADARLTFWPPIALTLDDVAWLGDDNEPAATASRVRARISLRALLHGRLVISTVSVDQPAATLARDADGATRLGGRPLGGSSAATRLPHGVDLDAVLPSLRVRDGTLLLIDRTVAPARRVALGAIRATITPLRPGARIELTASGISSGALRIGAARLGAVQVHATVASCAPPLRGEIRLTADDAEAATIAGWLPTGLSDAALQGHLRVGADLRGALAAGELHAFAELDEGRLDWHAAQAVAPLAVRTTAAWSDSRFYSASTEFDLAGLQRAALEARTLHASVNWNGTVATLTGARATAYGGTWLQSGQVTLTEQPLISGELRGEDIDGAALARALGAAVPQLRALRADGPLTINASGRGVVGQNLRGHLDLHQSGGALRWSALRLSAPLSFAAELSQQGADWTIANGTAHAAALAIDRGTVRDVDARFALANGALRVDSLTATANGDAWRVSGSLPLQPGTPGSLRASGHSGGLDLPDIEATFIRQPDGLQIPSLRARVFGATWSGAATSISSAGIQARVSVTDVNLQQLLATLAEDSATPQSPGGIASLTADLDLKADGQRRIDLDLRLSKGQFVWNDLTVDAPGQFRGVLRSDRDLAVEHATASAAGVQYGPLRGQNASAAFEYARNELTFSAMAFQAAGGAWKHTGSYQLDGAYPLSGTLSLTHVDPAAALTMLGRQTAPVDGAKLDLDANWRGNALRDWSHTLTGSGSATLRGGTLRSTAIISALWDALLRRARRSDVVVSHNALQVLSADFTLRDALLHTTDLRLASTDYDLTGSGSLGLDGSVDLETQITLTSAGLQHMFSLGLIPLPTSMLPSLPPIPTRLSGTADALVVHPDVGHLPASALHWAADMPRAIGGAVLKPFEDLVDDARNAIGDPAATPAAAP
ncbi:MAG: AsmA-like C-terminal region-containing protein [bacterium]